MDQPDETIANNAEAPLPPHRTSIGIKLPLIVVGLMLFAFLVYTYVSIRVSQGSLTDNLKEDLQTETSSKTELIESTLTGARTIAVNMASAVQSGTYDENGLDLLIQSTLKNNAQVFGSTVAYEPYQFKQDFYYWSPYYNRTADNTFKFTQLGNPEYNYFNQEWYSLPKEKLVPTLSTPYFDAGGGEIWMVTWSVPFYNQSGEFKGVTTADIDFSNIQNILTAKQIGNGGYAFLIDSKGIILGIGAKGGELQVMTDSMVTAGTSTVTVNWSELIKNMIDGKSGVMNATDINGVPLYVSYAPIGLDTGWSVGVAYPREEVLTKTTSLQSSLIAYSFLSAILFGGIIFFFTRSITTPLRKLTQAASQIAAEKPENIQEQLRNPIQIQTQDELEDLASAFNQMALTLNRFVEGLEEKVTERTRELEDSRQQIETRAGELQAINDISKVINSEQNLPILLPLITRLVSKHFGFYHTGIFLLDDTKKYAVLQAANSLGGEAMLARGHKLEVGESGIVGYVAKSGTPRIVQDVGLDVVFFNNPDLPETRSEMALPLTVQNKILGVLDLQSKVSGVFSDAELNTMSILADQVAIAIENARLFQQTQQALTEAEALYRQNTQKVWKEFSRDETTIGYHQTLTGGNKLSAPMASNDIREVMNRGESMVFNGSDASAETSIVVPIKLRGQVIGALKVKAPEHERKWSKDEINLANIISERLSLAIENSRLIQESQNRAATEQIISDIAAKIGASVRTENILRTTALELSQLLDNANIFIDLHSRSTDTEANTEEKGFE